jgi:Tol biopolymer transport system component/tRNA A-37 threonylcarbamoyl transferase component Bud32
VTPEHLRQIEELYHSAREREPCERGAFLAEACHRDEDLLREVESLLAQDVSGGPMERPAMEVAADLLADSTVTQLAVGTQLGPYKIEAPLGAGGMGQVYRARDTRLGRAVAIKIANQRFSERFELEARAISALNHPHICTLYDIGPNYLVMELVEGETLAARLRKGALSIELVLRYSVQIADALAAAHAQGIMHRDLKPANIMVTKAGVKVLDFGLAKMTPSPNGPQAATITATQAVMGTLAYMAPEQLEGTQCDARSDVFSLGLVLYEMAGGKRAFRGDSQAALIAEVMRCEPAPLAGKPPQFAHVVERCLAKDPENRWQTARDLKAELEWATLQEEASAPAADSRRSVLPWAAATALAIVAAIGWWIAWRPTRPVDRPLLRLSVDLGPDAVIGKNITAAISPDGTRLAFPAKGPDGQTQLATRLLDQPQATLLSGTEGAAAPFFSPDGQWIGFFAERKMKKVSVQGDAVITLCDAGDGRGASWGEDGNIIATLDSNAGIGLSRVPASGGTPQAVTRPSETGEATHRWPQILPGGQAVLFMGNQTTGTFDDSSIEVLSLKTGQVKVVLRGGYFGRYLPGGYLIYIHERTLFGVPFDLNRLEVRGTPAPLQADVAVNSNTAGGQMDFSRNGTLVYLSGKSSTGTWTIAWLDRDGKTQPLLAAPGIYFQPRFSPDGKRLAFSTNTTGIEIYDWGRGTRERLNSTAQATSLEPVWTPDGKHIIFESLSPSDFSLQWIRADGGGEAQQLWESKNRLIPYSFSPDGKRLAFSERTAKAESDLWTLPLDTSEPEHPKPGKPELFLGTPFAEEDPAFSPDGRWIAYASTESGRSEVYVRPFPAGGPSGLGRSTISTGGGRFPIWSRDGLELFYLGQDNRIMSAAYAAKGDSFTAGKPRPWSNTQLFDIGLANLDLAPDGKRFVVAAAPPADSTGILKGSVHVTFLLNFFDELRRRAPAAK